LLVEGLLWFRHRLSLPLISRLRLYGIDSRNNKFNKAWTKKFCINNKELNFKIDTGDDVTVISVNDFKGIKGQTEKFIVSVENELQDRHQQTINVHY
jgi:hypothetical protein